VGDKQGLNTSGILEMRQLFITDKVEFNLVQKNLQADTAVLTECISKSRVPDGVFELPNHGTRSAFHCSEQ
jgi:hypothetical protein